MQNNRKAFEGSKSTIRSIEAAIEVGLLTLVYYLIWRNGYDEGIFPAYYGYGKYVLAGVYGLLLIVLFHNFDGFKFGYLKLPDLIISQWIALFITNFITYWQLCLIANVMITPVPVLMLTVAGLIASFICAYGYSALYHRIYIPKDMVMIYGSKRSVSLKAKMDSRSDKYRISKMIHVDEGYDAIVAQIVEYDAVILNDIPAQIRNDLLKFCYGKGIRTYVAPKLTDIINMGATNISLFDTPLLLVRGKGLSYTQRAVKRLMDLVMASVVLVLASPVMILVAAAIKLEDGGPVFYKQKRVTRGGKVFEIYKFRSMVVDAEKDGISIPATDRDPRITRVGRFTRATRIDELPQLLNILKGEMSVVGPRPERVEHVEEYTARIPEFSYRLKVKGGLTGYAQIYGKYNTTPYDKIRLDLMYIEKYSLMLDIKLILMTLRIMLKKESTEGFAEEQESEEN